MIIAFSLNGADIEIDTSPHRRAIDLFREEFQIRSLRMQCNRRLCGSCLILMDNRPVHSCMLPCFDLRFRDVWTMEGISGTEGFQDILLGFKKANVQLCSSCAPARGLMTESLLRQASRPSADQLRDAVDSVRCDCSSSSRILDGMIRAARIRERRSHGR